MFWFYGAKAVKTPEQRLMQAAFQGDVATVRYCIEQDNVDVNAKCYATIVRKNNLVQKSKQKLKWIQHNEDGGTALHFAIEPGSIAVVKYLLTVPGIDINCICKLDGMSPLYRAIRYNRIEIAYMLLRAGADYTQIINDAALYSGGYRIGGLLAGRALPSVKVRSATNWSARDIALNAGKQGRRIAHRMDDIGRKHELFAALESNNEQQARLLLQKVPYTLKDGQDNTLLHKAVQYCSPELVGLILKLNTQAITEYNKQVQTPVDVAVAHNRWEVLELFIKLAHAQPSPVNYSQDPCTVPVACQIL